MIKRICEVCSKEFATWPYVVRNGLGRYCSKACGYTTLGKRLSDRALSSRPEIKYVDDYAMVPVGIREWMKVSIQDAEPLSKYVWSIGTFGYAYCVRRSSRLNAHRFVYERMSGEKLPKSILIDHKDRDNLNNRRENLRKCTYAQNNSNMGISSRNSSGFKGVSYCRQTGKWRAAITSQGTVFRLGRFSSAELAASHYDQWAIQLHGEFAVLNFTYQ